MKKVLALVLALAMAAGMSTMALAASIGPEDGSDENSFGDEMLLPGEEYKITMPALTDVKYKDDSTTVAKAEEATSVSVKWSKGGAMVASLSLKDKGKTTAYMNLKLNENYTLEDLKDLEGTVTIKFSAKLGDAGKQKTYTTTGKFTILGSVSNMTGNIGVNDNWDDAEDSPQELADNTVYTVDDSGKVVLQSGTRLLQVRASVKDDQKIFMVLDEKTIYDVIDYLDDKGVDYDDLAFYNAKGRFSFSSGRAEAVVNSDFSKKPHIYSWDGSKLSAVKGAKWNDGEGTYTVPVTGPFQFVLSNNALIVEKEESSSEPEEDKGNDTTTNPDTGANDFVGLAVALAVVSVAGIAVAKKH